MLGSYLSLLTPITNIGASFEGALITTFLAPALMWAWAFSIVVNTPEHSRTYSTPSFPHGMLFGSISLYTLIVFPNVSSSENNEYDAIKFANSCAYKLTSACACGSNRKSKNTNKVLKVNVIYRLPHCTFIGKYPLASSFSTPWSNKSL